MSQAGQFYISTFIATLTGDTGGAIVPVAGNIDIVGGPGVTVAGTAGTLTINMSGASDSFITDAGTAVPDALGDINVLGGANINTTGAGNTITVILDNDVTLSGQLEANEVESITYITAGTNITSTTGNITAVAGNVVAGAELTSVGDITTSTGDITATIGGLVIGGTADVGGDITSTAGDLIAQNDITAVTGDITASAGAGDFATTVTAGTNIISTAGNISTAAGTITASNGLIATTGGVLASAGDITASLGNILTSTGTIDSASTMSAVGNITSSTGSLVSTLGSVSAATTVAAGTSITAGTNITSTAGDIAASAGTITASGNITSSGGNVASTTGSVDAGTTMSAVGDITTSTGDLVSTTGDIRAPLGTLFVGTFSATGDIVTSAGNLIATIGDVIAGDEVTSGGRITAGTGLTVTAGGVLVSAGDVLASTGNVTAQTSLRAIVGDINAPLGDITAGFDVVAGADISSILGDVTAEMGDVLARYDVEALEGDIIAHGGDIRTLAGFIRSAGAVIADVNLDVTGTVQFRDITDGGLVADATGFVSASVGFTDPFTGFATWTGAGAYYDDSVLGTFEVSRGGTGFIKGLPVTWAGSQSETGLTGGNTYYIYMDDTGTIGSTSTRTDALYSDYIVLFEMLRDSTGTNIQYTVKENHPYTYPWNSSNYAHDIIGTVIENTNNGANITLNGTQKIEIVGADELEDHGLETTIPDGGGTPPSWNQMYTTGGGKWATYQSSDTFNGFWNNAGTPAAGSGTKWSVYTLYVSKDDITAATPTYWAVLDDQEYNNLNAAQTAIADGSMAIATAELAALEFAQLGHIIYRQSTATIVDVIIEKSTLRSTVSGGAGSSDAALVLTDVTNFDGILSATDTTVQVSLETIDDWGASTTDHAVLIGNGTGSAIGSLAVGATGEMLIGNTGADPTWSATGALTTLNATTVTATTVNATTLDTNVAAAGVTLAGTSLLADGTDPNININITAKGTGQVIIDDLQLTAALTVPYGGSGAATFTDHGVLVGSGAAVMTALAVGTNGQLLVGSSAADPVFATVASADASIEITGGAGTIDLSATGILSINAQTGTTYEFLLTDVGKLVTCSNAGAITVTIPVNGDVAIPIGSQVLVNQLGAGVVTLAPEGGVTLSSRGALLDTNGQYATAACIKIDTNIWLIQGDLA